MNPNTRYISRIKKKYKEKRDELLNDHLKVLQLLLPETTIYNLCKKINYKFRKRFITPSVIVFHMILAALTPEGSFQKAWQNAGQSGKSGALSKARNRLPVRLWVEIYKWIIDKLVSIYDADQRWKGHRLIGIDGTCVSMSDNIDLVYEFGKTKSKHGLSRFPIAQILFAFSLKGMFCVGHKVSSKNIGESTLLKKMLGSFKKGDLLIADRAFSGANLFHLYMKYGLDFLIRKHQRLKLENLKIIERFGDKDFIAYMSLIKKHLKESPDFPKQVKVRVVGKEIKIRDKKKLVWIVTSLLDHKKYTLNEIFELYKKRWKAEDLIREFKIILGADVLRSKKGNGIYKEIYARIAAFNLIHWLILEASTKHRKDPKRTSFSAAVRLTVVYSAKLSSAAIRKIPKIVRALLKNIANSQNAYRPNRTEPRMKKREYKHFSQLKISREDWRRNYAMA